MATPPDAQGPGSVLDPPAADAEVVTDKARQRRILAAMCLALVAVVASVSGLNVAMQDLAIEFGASQSTLLWIINGYTLALASLLMPIGAIGDRWGRKPVLITGLVLFGVTNLIAALATSATVMLAARIGAGAAAAMIMPVTLSVITTSFPEEERARGVGIWAGFAGAGGIIGLFVSSFLIDFFTWPWLFALPTLLAAGALALTLTSVGNSREDHAGRFDVVGSLLSVVGIGGLVLAIHEGPEQGWTYGLTVAGLVVGLLGLLGFVVWELRQRHPLMDVRLFANRGLAAGSITLMALFAVMFGIFLVLVQFLQVVLDWSALKAATGLLPMALVMMPLSTFSPRIAERIGNRNILLVGVGTFGAGLVVLATMSSVDGGYWSVLPGLLVTGVGVGLSMTTATTVITGSMPVEKQGVASAVNDTVREIGGAIGVALLGSVLNSGYRSSVSSATAALPDEAANAVEEGVTGAMVVADSLGEAGSGLASAAREAFVSGWHGAMWIGAGVAAATFVFLLLRGPRDADDTATVELHLLDGASGPMPALADAD